MLHVAFDKATGRKGHAQTVFLEEGTAERKSVEIITIRFRLQRHTAGATTAMERQFEFPWQILTDASENETAKTRVVFVRFVRFVIAVSHVHVHKQRSTFEYGPIHVARKRSFLGVNEVAVSGVQHPVLVERVVAHLVVREGVT